MIKNIRLGDTGPEVLEVNSLLFELKYKVNAKHFFDLDTRAAIEDFQACKNLIISGIVDTVTLDTLRKECGKNIQASTISMQEVSYLRQGMRGESIIDLQNDLKRLGYYNGTIDGIFGPQTRESVIKFQQTNRLINDGIVGPATYDAIYNHINNNARTTNNNITISRPILKLGSQNHEYVILLQRMLNDSSFYFGNMDGKFGPATETAVIKFQEANNLIDDGIVGPATWAKLEYNSIEILDKYPDLQLNSTGNYVSILQNQLKLLDFFAGTITGSFSQDTEDAVKAFQSANNLEPNGIVDKNTWILLLNESLTPFKQIDEKNQLKPVLKLGDEGEYVSSLQTQLKNLLLYNGEITGIFDNNTQVALKTFQQINKLIPDGVAGRRTWDSLQSLYEPPIIINQ